MSIILVVHVDPQVRGRLRNLLEAKGHQVAEACDGYEALAYLTRADPALVVLDLFLPKVDGFEIISYLRSNASLIKILAIPGDSIPGFDACEIARLLGAGDTLPQPFNTDLFLHRVDSLLAQP